MLKLTAVAQMHEFYKSCEARKKFAALMVNEQFLVIC